MTDIIFNKKVSIEKCIQQIRRYYSFPSSKPFEEDHFKQDAIAINIQRACEQSIDLANHIIRKKKLGLPASSGESFSILEDNKIIEPSLAENLRKMVSFRNILIHEYRKLDISLMKKVIGEHLEDILDFTKIIQKKFSKS